MQMPKNNCYGCTDRHVGCHTDCSSYLIYTNERKSERERIWNNRQVDKLYDTYFKEVGKRIYK